QQGTPIDFMHFAVENQRSTMATEPDARHFTKLDEQEFLSQAEPQIIDVGLDNLKRFKERDHFRTDERFEYPRTGSDPGQILIFNQERFTYKPERKGSTRDVNEIIQSFQRLGYNVEKKDILNDGTTADVKQKLAQVARGDLSEKNCLIVFFLTHGDVKDRLSTRDSSITANELWENFRHCPGLENKPKMFVIQASSLACKGDDFSTTVQTNISKPSEIVQDNTFSNTFLGPDMLVLYSTSEGNVSFRSGLTGTWFIQELCKNVTAYGRRDDVFGLVTRTLKCVNGNYFHSEAGVYKKQTPVCVSTLSKKFYLNRNKDRAMILKYHDYYKEVMERVERIEEQLRRLEGK
ncbi:hypothetical protein NQ315_006453, partial [Exocentrus adspersus]